MWRGVKKLAFSGAACILGIIFHSPYAAGDIPVRRLDAPVPLVFEITWNSSLSRNGQIELVQPGPNEFGLGLFSGTTQLNLGSELLTVSDSRATAETLDENLLLCQPTSDRSAKLYSVKEGRHPVGFPAPCSNPYSLPEAKHAKVGLEPGVRISKLIALSAMLDQGVLTLPQFEKKVATLAGAKIAVQLAKLTLLGEGEPPSFPIKLKIKVGTEEIVASGILRLERWYGDYEEARAVFGNSSEADREKVLSLCRAQPATSDLGRALCERAQYRVQRGESFSSGMRTSIGQSILMRDLAGGCARSVSAEGSATANPMAQERGIAFAKLMSIAGMLQATDLAGRNALTYAAYWGCWGEYAELSRRGLKPVAVDRWGNTFLEYAAVGKVPNALKEGLKLIRLKDFTRKRNRHWTNGASYELMNGLPMFPEPATRLIFAAGEPRAIDRLLDLYTGASEADWDKLIQQALESYDPAVLEKLLQRKVNFWRGKENHERNLATDFINQRVRDPEPKHQEFIALLRQKFGAQSAGEQANCSREQSPRNCFTQYGLCEKIQDSSQRDVCLSSKSRCAEVKDPYAYLRCVSLQHSENLKNLCDRFRGAEPDLSFCRLAVSGPLLPPDRWNLALENSLKSEANMKHLMELSYEVRRPSPTDPEMREAFRRCTSSPFVTKIFSSDVDGFRACSIASIVGNSATLASAEIQKCEYQGDWASCAFPVYNSFSYTKNSTPESLRDKHSASTAATRLCSDGNANACVAAIVLSNSGETVFGRGKLLVRACKQAPQAPFCNDAFIIEGSPNSPEAFEESLKFLPQKFPGTYLSITGLLRRKAGPASRLAPLLPAIEANCPSEISACELAIVAYQQLGDANGAARNEDRLLPLLKVGCEEDNCNGFAPYTNVPGRVHDFLVERCKSRDRHACALFQAKDSAAFVPPFSMEEISGECLESRSPSKRQRCYADYVEKANRVMPLRPLLFDLCSASSWAQQNCEGARPQLLAKLQKNKASRQELRDSCVQAHEAPACSTLATLLEAEKSPAAAEFFEKACALAPIDVNDCYHYLRAVVVKHNPERAKAAFEKLCDHDGPSACQRRGLLMAAAGGDQEAVVPLEKNCSRGINAECELVRDFLRLSGHPEKIHPLRVKMCKLHPDHDCDAAWEQKERWF